MFRLSGLSEESTISLIEMRSDLDSIGAGQNK
jgi:hypothetical protein